MKMNDYIKLVDETLDKYMEVNYPEDIFKSMRYTVLLPGKRLRPVMCLESASLFGADYNDALPAACAVEMLHAQTLIHDDLPCMDNDDFRRGKPANHKVFSEATAVLAGDALLSFAPQVILKKSRNLRPETLLKVLNEFFQAAGAYGVIAGQIVDIESENSQPENPEDTLRFIHTHKTADLFNLALRTGAIIGNADDEQLNLITNFGSCLGFAFQIRDDILDEISTFEEMGKTLGKDKNSGKLTYTALHGLEKSKKDLDCLLNKCLTILKDNNFKSDVFEEIISKLRVKD